jgi:hypothetical protein
MNKKHKRLYHACIQKTGSQWIKKIFNDFAENRDC